MLRKALPEEDFSKEANWLAAMRLADQIAYIERLRTFAAAQGVRKADRERVTRKADALEHLLNLKPAKGVSLAQPPLHQPRKRRRRK